MKFKIIFFIYSYENIGISSIYLLSMGSVTHSSKFIKTIPGRTFLGNDEIFF